MTEWCIAARYSGVIMLGENAYVEGEHRLNAKLCMKLDKTVTDTCNLLQHVYAEHNLSRSGVFESHKSFLLAYGSAEEGYTSSFRSQIYLHQEKLPHRDSVLP